MVSLLLQCVCLALCANLYVYLRLRGFSCKSVGFLFRFFCSVCKHEHTLLKIAKSCKSKHFFSCDVCRLPLFRGKNVIQSKQPFYFPVLANILLCVCTLKQVQCIKTEKQKSQPLLKITHFNWYPKQKKLFMLIFSPCKLSFFCKLRFKFVVLRCIHKMYAQKRHR